MTPNLHKQRQPYIPTARANDTNEETDPGREDGNINNSFDLKRLIAILLLTLVKPICYDIVLPFINRMILELGTVTDAKKVGPYSGFLMSMFSIMVITSLLPWSLLSDRFGRKPVILLGSSGMAVTITAFGLSANYRMMVIVMSLSGCLAGTTAILRVLIAETYPLKAHRITALTAQQIAFRVAQMTGDTLGGVLSHPERKFSLFNSDFWRRHPFALPCFAASMVSAIASVYGGLTLRETRPPRTHEHRHQQASISYTNPETEPLISQLQQSSRRPSSNVLHSLLASLPSLPLFTLRVRAILISIFLMAVSSETLFALYPLLAFTPPSSGLGLPPTTIGFHMALRSALNIVTMCLAAPIQQRVGGVRTFRWGMGCIGAAVVVMWVLVGVHSHEVGVSVGVGNTTMPGAGDEEGKLGFMGNSLIAIFLLFWGAGSLVWPSSQVILVESPASPEDLALVVGISQIVQWIGMALSPIFINNLYSYSITRSIPLVGRNLTFLILLTLNALGLWKSYSLKENWDEASATVKTVDPERA